MHRGQRKSALGHIPAALLLCALLGVSALAGAHGTTESSGHVLRAAIPMAAFALAVKRGDRAGRLGFSKAFAANVAGTWGLKEIVDKRTPAGKGSRAFPSGHTSMAFQGAAFLHRRYGIEHAWAAYALAAYVGWTRIDAKRHDAADVLAGAALGIASSFLLNRPRPQSEAVGLVMHAHEDFIGLRLHVAF